MLSALTARAATTVATAQTNAVTSTPCEKGCDDQCKVPGANRGPCCDKPGCDARIVDFDTRPLITSPKAINNLGGYGPQRDANGTRTVDGGTLAEEMRLPEAGSFIDRGNLNGVPNAVVVFDVVITAIGESASGRKAGPYHPRNTDYNGIYTHKKYDVGKKADIISINFGPCVCSACRMGVCWLGW